MLSPREEKMLMKKKIYIYGMEMSVSEKLIVRGNIYIENTQFVKKMTKSN